MMTDAANHTAVDILQQKGKNGVGRNRNSVYRPEYQTPLNEL